MYMPRQDRLTRGYIRPTFYWSPVKAMRVSILSPFGKALGKVFTQPISMRRILFWACINLTPLHKDPYHIMLCTPHLTCVCVLSAMPRESRRHGLS